MAKLNLSDDQLELEDGSSLKEVCEEAGIPFACSEGICGTCVIEVKDGKENLSEMTQEELDFLVSGLTGETNESPKLSLKHKITKQEKNSLLRECNKIVLKIANVSDLNPTLLFSKRLQKEFFELALCSGVNGASTLLTEWRKELLFLPLSKLFFKYGFTD